MARWVIVFFCCQIYRILAAALGCRGFFVQILKFKGELMNTKTTIITSEKNWLEHTAITQLDALANLDGAIQVVGLPDLHAGKTPVGLALVTENKIYPHIIGNDIGCGMSLY